MPPYPIPTLQLLRDLPLRVSVPEAIRQSIDDYLARSAPITDTLAYFGEGEALVQRAIDFLDAESSRLTQERFGSNDANALRQKMLAEPRRQLDQVVAGMKQKISSDRADWGRRITKQIRDVQTTLDREMAAIAFDVRPDVDGLLLRVNDDWKRRFDGWKDEVFGRWREHLGELLVAKHAELLRGDVDHIESIIDGKLEVPMPPAHVPPFAPVLDERLFEARFEAPSTMEAIFETFKNGVNTVAMLAGMIVIPVVGSLSHEQPLTLRAGIMGGMLIPIVFFAIYQGRKARSKLVDQNTAKAREQVTKAVATEFRAQIDRFKSDAERYCGVYGQEALSAATSVVEPAIARHFEKRERSLAADLANAQVTIDRLNDQLMALKQAKTALSTQLLVDLRRKLTELRG